MLKIKNINKGINKANNLEELPTSSNQKQDNKNPLTHKNHHQDWKAIKTHLFKLHQEK